MNTVIAIFASVMLSIALSVTMVLLLRQPLFNLLVELCGNAARAGFWAAFSLLFTSLSALFGVLASLPERDAALMAYPGLLLALTGFRAAIVGLLLSLLAIAGILLGAIRRYEEAEPRRS